MKAHFKWEHEDAAPGKLMKGNNPWQGFNNIYKISNAEIEDEYKGW